MRVNPQKKKSGTQTCNQTMTCIGWVELLLAPTKLPTSSSWIIAAFPPRKDTRKERRPPVRGLTRLQGCGIYRVRPRGQVGFHNATWENGYRRRVLEQACAFFEHHRLAGGGGIGHGADRPSNWWSYDKHDRSKASWVKTYLKPPPYLSL